MSKRPQRLSKEAILRRLDRLVAMEDGYTGPDKATFVEAINRKIIELARETREDKRTPDYREKQG